MNFAYSSPGFLEIFLDFPLPSQRSLRGFLPSTSWKARRRLISFVTDLWDHVNKRKANGLHRQTSENGAMSFYMLRALIKLLRMPIHQCLSVFLFSRWSFSSFFAVRTLNGREKLTSVRSPSIREIICPSSIFVVEWEFNVIKIGKILNKWLKVDGEKARKKLQSRWKKAKGKSRGRLSRSEVYLEKVAVHEKKLRQEPIFKSLPEPVRKIWTRKVCAKILRCVGKWFCWCKK